MMRRTSLASLAFLLILLPIPALAVPAAPEKTVWIEPASADEGEAIELSAFVYNRTAKTATVTVLFAAGETEIATTIITVAPQTGKVALAPWQQPKETTVVTASVVKALDAAKKNIPELLGIIGTATIGAENSPLISDELQGDIKEWVTSIVAKFEPWRKKQAQYFVALRDRKKDELGINSVKDITDRFEQKDAEAPATPGEEPTLADLTTSDSDIPLASYAVLIYATSLAAMFSSFALFYITVVLLAILVLRFFFSLFR